MRAFVVLGFVFPYQSAKRWAWGTCPKLPILCRVGCKTLSQYACPWGMAKLSGQLNLSMVFLQMVSYLTTDRAWQRVTSLMCTTPQQARLLPCACKAGCYAVAYLYYY